MPLPNLNWPADLYIDVMTCPLECGSLVDPDQLSARRHSGARATRSVEFNVDGDVFRLITIGGIPVHAGMTAS